MLSAGERRRWERWNESRDRQARSGRTRCKGGSDAELRTKVSDTPKERCHSCGPTKHLLQGLQALVDHQGFCQGLGTSRTN